MLAVEPILTILAGASAASVEGQPKSSPICSSLKGPYCANVFARLPKVPLNASLRPLFGVLGVFVSALCIVTRMERTCQLSDCCDRLSKGVFPSSGLSTASSSTNSAMPRLLAASEATSTSSPSIDSPPRPQPFCLPFCCCLPVSLQVSCSCLWQQNKPPYSTASMDL